MSAAATLAVPAVAVSQAQRSEEIQMTADVEHINPEGLHKSPVFSQGIVVPAGARILIIGGQNGVDDRGQVVSNDLAGQTAKAVDNLIKVLETAGGTLDDLVRVGVYIKGEGDIRPGFNEWMKRAGQIKNPPTVTAMRALGLANPDFLIEIEAMAVLK
jgi:enamine deaminase RidA (YjgF/YER057c/UK114 family)